MKLFGVPIARRLLTCEDAQTGDGWNKLLVELSEVTMPVAALFCLRIGIDLLSPTWKDATNWFAND